MWEGGKKTVSLIQVHDNIHEKCATKNRRKRNKWGYNIWFMSSGLIIDLKPKYDITIFGMKVDISDKMNKRCVTAFNPFDN